MPSDASDPRLASREIQLLPEGEIAVYSVSIPTLDDSDLATRLGRLDPSMPRSDDLPSPEDLKTGSEIGFEPELAKLWDQALLAEYDASEPENQQYLRVYKAVVSGERKMPLEVGLKVSISECSILENGCLGFRDRLWIPFYEPLRTRILEDVHTGPLSGHSEREVTYASVARQFF